MSSAPFESLPVVPSAAPPAARPGTSATRLNLLIAAGWLAVSVCPGGQVARGANPDEAADSASDSDSFREVQEQSQAKKSSSRKGVKASASASGMMSGSAGGRSMGNGFGGGQGQGSGSQMGPAFGKAGSGAASNAALDGQMKMKVSISTDDDEEEPQPDTLDPYVPGGPGGDEMDDANVMRRMDGGRRITTIERAGETITITDSPTRIVVHRLDRTVDPPASSYVAATTPRALAAKDPAAYDLFDRYVVKTPAGRPAAAPTWPARSGMPAMPDMNELPRTGSPEMDRMLDDFFKSQR